MSQSKRPAAYIRIARGGGAATLAGQRHAILAAARAHGWSEPAVYFDVAGADGGAGAGTGLARLAVAISTGQHDALILGGVGMIYRNPADLMRLLHGCTHNGVAVECVTGVATARSSSGFPGQA